MNALEEGYRQKIPHIGYPFLSSTDIRKQNWHHRRLMFVPVSFATCIIFKFIFMSLGEGHPVKKEYGPVGKKLDP